MLIRKINNKIIFFLLFWQYFTCCILNFWTSSGGMKLSICNLIFFFHFSIAGTYDAISLSDDNPQSRRYDYIEATNKMLRENGLFIMTTCNWTEQEITDHFSKCELQFFYHVPVTLSYTFLHRWCHTFMSNEFLKTKLSWLFCEFLSFYLLPHHHSLFP